MSASLTDPFNRRPTEPEAPADRCCTNRTAIRATQRATSARCLARIAVAAEQQFVAA